MNRWADDQLGLLFAGEWYGLAAESSDLSGAGVTRPDSHGQTITGMVFRKTDWSSNPGDPHITYTITYYGVPEPAAMILFTMGTLGLLARRRHSLGATDTMVSDRRPRHCCTARIRVGPAVTAANGIIFQGANPRSRLTRSLAKTVPFRLGTV